MSQTRHRETMSGTGPSTVAECPIVIFFNPLMSTVGYHTARIVARSRRNGVGAGIAARRAVCLNFQEGAIELLPASAWVVR